jgi:signal transduction histidine kinase
VISKPKVLEITRLVAGLCVSAGLIYFVYSKNSPAAVVALIILTVFLFSVFSRGSPALYNNRYFAEIEKSGSQTPLRDLAKASVCFVALMAFTIGVAIADMHKLIPDNYVITGCWVGVVAVSGLAAVFFAVRALIVFRVNRH